MNTENKYPEIFDNTVCPMFIHNEAAKKGVSKELIIFDRLEQMKVELKAANSDNPRPFEIETKYGYNENDKTYELKAELIYNDKNERKTANVMMTFETNNEGHVVSVTTRLLTLADLGVTAYINSK